MPEGVSAMSSMRIAADGIESVQKDLKKFTTMFILSTESVSFLAIIPMIVLYAWTNFNMSPEQAAIFFQWVAVAVTFGLISTNITDRIIVAPITRYFKKLLRGEPVTDEEYLRAQVRFFKLPYIYAVNSAFQWLAGLSVCAVPFTLTADNLTAMQEIPSRSVIARVTQWALSEA